MMNSLSDSKLCPTKVERVRLRDFRGWAVKHEHEHEHEHDVVLDADFVLVSGANGHGKSSLLEALARALGGVGTKRDDAIPTVRQKKGTADDRGPSIGQWSVDVTCKGDDISFTLHIDQDQPVRPLHDDYPGPKTIRRATLFTQDSPEAQFERPEDGNDTLLGFLVPFPRWLKKYETAVAKAIVHLESQRPRRLGETQILKARRRRDKEATRLADRLADRLGEGRPTGDAEPMERLAALARQLAEGPRGKPGGVVWAKQLLRAIERESLRTEGDRERLQKALQERESAQQELDEFDERWPPELVGEIAQWFQGATDLEDLLKLLAGLAERPERWSEARGLDELLKKLPEESRREIPSIAGAENEIGDELKRVDRARAKRVHQVFAAWSGHWKNIIEHRQKLQRKLDQAERELRRLQATLWDTELRRLAERLVESEQELEAAKREADEDARRQERWPHIEARLIALERQQTFCADLRRTQLAKSVVEGVESTMNAVMKHFVVAGHKDASDDLISVQHDGHILTPDFSDGRKLFQHLSTGQKAQEALAWLLGTNVLLQRWLPHRLLLLDDISTALDLTNLSAECALLRKFAYASGNPQRKRQVVLATHHDQLTHRILDLLIPPEGFTMREIQIVDWSMKDGPTVETFKIKPTRKATDETRRELAEALAQPFRGEH